MLEWLYRKIFVSVVESGKEFDVTVCAYKQKKRLYKETKHFGGEDAFDGMAAYVQKHTQESPLHFIAVLNPEPNQGAIEGCSMHDISKEGDVSGAKTLCRKQQWVLYASLRELDTVQHRYAKIGLDFIFSPFSVMERFFADKIGGGLALYGLAQRNSLSLAFFENGKLEYAHYYPMHQDEKSESPEESSLGFSVGVEEEDEKEKGIDLDEIESLDDLEIIDELDDLSDIDNLDDLEEIAEFSDDTTAYDHLNASRSKGSEAKEEMDRYNDDYYRFEMIQTTLSRFYKGEHCRNRFVETVYIADATGSCSELKRYLEEELFLGVLIRRIDLSEEVMALSLEEEGL